MEKIKFFAILWIGAILLAACTSVNPVAAPLTDPTQASDQSAGSAPQTGGFASPLKTDYENALPVGSQLALGLFKLEETDFPLTAEQAAALVPLWKAYKSLSASEASAPQELDALITQAQQTLSQDQLQAILDMRLTGDDLRQFAEQREITLGGAGFDLNLSPEMIATRQARRSSGQAPSGGGFGPGGPGGGEFDPGSGFAPPASGAATPNPRGTPGAGRLGFGTGRVNSGLVQALIDYLGAWSG